MNQITDKFLERHTIKTDSRRNRKSWINFREEIELIMKKSHEKKIPDTDGFTGEF